MSESSFLRRILLAAWYLSATLAVMGAVFLSIARLVLPLMDEYRIELQGWASRNVGYPVEVGRLNIAWRGLGPELQLENFRLMDDSGDILLGADRVGLGIDLLRTALAGELRLSVATITGTDLSLVRLESGRIVLEGMEHIQPSSHPLRVFLSQPRFEVNQSSLQWHDRGVGGRAWKFNRINLRMTSRGERHRLALKADLPVALGRQFELAADLTGPGIEISDWGGRVYVNGRDLHLQRWMHTPLPGGVIANAVFDVEAWMDVRAGIVEDVSADIGLHNLEVWSGQDDIEPFTLDRLGGNLLWQRERYGWRLDLNQLLVEFPGRLWPTSGGTLVWNSSDTSASRIELAADYLDVADVVRLAKNLPAAGFSRIEELYGLNPRGTVRDLRFGYERPGAHWVVKATFEDLNTTAYSSWPGVSGLHGYVTGADDRGRMVLGGTDVRMHAPVQFPEPLEFGVVDAEVNWAQHEDLLRIDVPLFEQYSGDFRTRARATLDIPPGEGEPVLDAYLAISDGDLRAVNRYLPASRMSPRVVSWLDQGFVSGRIESGGVLFHGPVSRFPFRNHEGRFEARLNVADAILDYRPGWPRIEELDAEVSFVNLGMLVRTGHGMIFDNELVDVSAGIEDLTKAPLAVNGKAVGPLSGMLRYVRESPLGVNYRRLLSSVKVDGDAELMLDLKVPLRGKDRRIKVDGKVSVAGNNLDMAPWDISLNGVEGLLNFNERGLYCRRLDAKLLGKPVQIEISQKTRDTRPVKQIVIEGRLPIIDHFRISELLPFAGISGESFWNLRIEIPKPAGPDDLAARVRLSSDLRGVGVELPAPYGKNVEDRRKFTLAYDFTDAPRRALNFSDGDLFSGVVELAIKTDATVFERGEIHLGEGDATLPSQPGLTVSGDIPELKVEDWLQWFRATDAMDKQGGPGHAQGREQLLRRVDLRIADLDLLDHHYADVALEAGRDDNAWAVTVTSPDASGLIRVPLSVTNEQPLDLRFDRLRIPLVQEPSRKERERTDPARIRPVKVDVKQFVYHDLDLGHMSLATRPVENGIHIESLTLRPQWMDLSANGVWRRIDNGDRSRFMVEIESEDFGDMLERFGYSAEMKGGETRLKIDAEWPGTPFELAFENVEGEFALKVGEGRLVDVEPGAGRIFGLLSLHSLQRRLTLDFSDLFKKGYTFDRIRGKFKLTDANAYTDDLFIDGPSARVEISGRAGLAAHDYDQLVTVVPRISSTLPIAGALAGGPAVGAALLLADKLLPEQMEKLTSFAQYEYSLTGTWENPQLTRLSTQKEKSSGEETDFYNADDDG